ncbi:MAG: amine dehydrogenase large subunit [Pseudomonadota bacterium]
MEAETPTPHWFIARGRHIGYLVDGDNGTVQGTMTLSMFTPAMQPHLSQDRIYAYGSYYSRTYYGDRTDLVVGYDAKTLAPVVEIEIPAKSAGIGHSGMIGLMGDRFIGVWNITPAMSVSIVDLQTEQFVGEISTPGCAAVYPMGEGFMMPCGDGTLQYIRLDADGREVSRIRSDAFFKIDEDPVYDYAVPTEDGWLMVSFDGLVYEVTLDGAALKISEPWSLFAGEDEDSEWRIGGYQPFAYNAPNRMLVALVHEGGGQETFEDPGSEVWAFSLDSKRRGYRLKLQGKDDEAPVLGSGLQLTQDATPLLMVAPDEDKALRIYDGRTGAHQRTLKEMGVRLLQNLDLGP